MAVSARDLARQHRAERSVQAADFSFDPHRRAVVDGRSRLRYQALVHRLVEVMVLALAVEHRDTRLCFHLMQNAAEVDALGFPVVNGLAHIQLFDRADHVVERAVAKLRHQFPDLFGNEEQVVDDVFRLAGEARAQDGVLRGDADRTGVQVAFAHHDAAGRDQWPGCETELVGAKQRAHHHIASGAQAAVDLHRNASAQAVQHQRLLGFGQADFPRRASMGQRGQRRGTGAALEPRDRHMIGPRLGHPGGNRADADFGNQFDRDTGARVGVLQVVDQLRQIFDRIDIVMRRRRDQSNTGS